METTKAAEPAVEPDDRARLLAEALAQENEPACVSRRELYCFGLGVAFGALLAVIIKS
jgi:hypothetical protein